MLGGLLVETFKPKVDDKDYQNKYTYIDKLMLQKSHFRTSKNNLLFTYTQILTFIESIFWFKLLIHKISLLKKKIVGESTRT